MGTLSASISVCEGNPRETDGSPHKGITIRNLRFPCCGTEQADEHTVELPVIWVATAASMWRYCYVLQQCPYQSRVFLITITEIYTKSLKWYIYIYMLRNRFHLSYTPQLMYWIVSQARFHSCYVKYQKRGCLPHTLIDRLQSSWPICYIDGLRNMWEQCISNGPTKSCTKPSIYHINHLCIMAIPIESPRRKRSVMWKYFP